MKTNKQEDYKLLLRIKRSDEKAFRKAYVKYNEELYETAIKYLRTKELAEDAVHDIFVKLWNKRRALKKSGSLKGFLFTAIKNHVLNIIGSNKREVKRNIEYKYEELAKISAGDNIIVLSEYKPVLYEAIERLPESRRQIFNLRLRGGLTNKEVADYLGISVHTVKSQYYKATKFIKGYIQKRTGLVN